MSYQITFKDRSSITVSNERGEKIKELRFDGKKDTPIDIDGNLYLVGSISKVEQVADPVIANPWANEKQLPLTTKPCRAQYSIQQTINRLAVKFGGHQSEYNPEGVKWSKLISDSDWRDMMRQVLLKKAPDAKWCDYKAGKCACDPNAPAQDQLGMVHDLLFPQPKPKIVKKKGKVPVKQNPDGSEEMPDDFLQ